jgi:signal transduction histidine kinase
MGEYEQLRRAIAWRSATMSQNTDTAQTAPGSQIPQPRNWIVNLAIVTAVVAAVAVNLLAPVLAWRWTRHPFLGLFLEPTLVISDVHNPAWPARQAGLRNADRLLAIDGRAITTAREVAAILDQKQPGQVVTLTIEKDPSAQQPMGDQPALPKGSESEQLPPQVIELDTPLIAFPWRDLLMAFGFPYLLGLLYLGLGIAVYRVRRDERSGQVFALFTVVFSIFTGSFFDVYGFHWLVHLWTLSIPLVGATLLHLALVFPAETQLIRRYPWLRFVPYVPALIIGLYAITTLDVPRAYFLPWRWCFAFAGLSALGFIILLLYNRFQATSPIVGQQARIVIWGSLAAFLPIIAWTLANLVEAQIPLSSAMFILVFVPLVLFPTSITYAILRYRLLNLDLVLSRSLVYLSLTLLVTSVYLIAVSLVGWLFQSSAGADDPALLALFVLALIFFLGPVRDRLQGLVDRTFLREATDYRLLLQDYGRELTSAPLEIERILAMLLERCEAALHPERAVIFLLDPTLNIYSVRNQIGPALPPGIRIQFGIDDELPRRLAAQRIEHPHDSEALHLSFNSEALPPTGFSAQELGRLTILSPELIVPLYGTESLIGWITLGPKRSGEPYRENDMVFLTTLANQTVIALENAQLLEAAERRALQLATLNQVSRVVNQTLDLDTVLWLIMQKSLELLDAEAGSLLLADDAAETLTFEVVLGPVGSQLRGARVAIGSSIAGTVARERRSLIVNDVQADPRWNVSFDKTTEFVTRNLICVPMVTHDRLVGVIEVLNKRAPACFSEEDTELLSSFAAQAAIAIENARLFTMTDQALAERVQELHTMQLIDQQLNATLELARVMDLTLEHALDAVAASSGVIGVLSEEGDGLYLVAQRGMPAECARYREEPWPVERGIIGRVARIGQPAMVGNVWEDPDFEPVSEQTHSQMAVPISYQDRVQAVISLESVHPDAFSQRDLDFVTRLADHAAIAIQNARLYYQAQAANQAKTEFMSIASHELKIPMTSIKGYAKLLTLGAGGALTERQNEFLEIISANVDRMDRLVADLLDVSRIEAGRLRLDMGPVDLRQVIDTVIQSVKTQIEAKQLTLEVKIPPTLPSVWGDQGRLVQVLNNLVSNAYKYTPNGGHIQIAVDGQTDTASSGQLAISVRDSGVGISPEDQQRLFTKFFRADDPRVREVPGTGLGLSITKSLVETHGGRIWFESELGHGTTFTFTLPIMSSDKA